MSNGRGESQTAISVSTELVSWNECSAIAAIDAKMLATDKASYCKRNAFQYYTAINSWLLQYDQIIGQRARFALYVNIKRNGLVSVIADAQALADALIRFHNFNEPLNVPAGWFIPEIRDMNLGEVLQCLRFLKRFTPKDADLLENATFDKFIEVNKRCRLSNLACHPIWITAGVLRHTTSMLRYFEKEYTHTYPHFSAGTTTRGQTLIRKIKGYSEGCKYWIDPLYPIGDPFQCCVPEADITIKAVPKNYKGYRLIGPEHPYYAAEKQRIKDAMRASIARTRYGKMYCPDSQLENQNMAFQGSIDGNYATIDLTSASDLISESLAYEMLPSFFTDIAFKYRVEWVTVGKKRLRKRMFATSGDPICFDAESFIFLGIALVCTELVRAFTGEKMLEPHVFGDDIIVDSRVFDTTMDILRILGMSPNVEKSFGTGGYRESCGVEYYYGYDTSTKYWPRRVILDPRKDVLSLESVVHLEQRMFWCWPVAAFLTDVALTCYPSLTSSDPGTDTSDLWADCPWYALRCAPVKLPCDVPEEWTKREAHTAFVATSAATHKWSLDVEMYHYVEFLRTGPVYDTALDELLGVSMPRQRATDYALPGVVVRKVTK